MELTKEIKIRFEDFCKIEFPGKKVCSNKENNNRWLFVQAGTHLDDELHYEFLENRVRLHIEGSNWRPIRDYLRNNVDDRLLSSEWWGRKECQWTLKKKIINEHVMFDSFRLIRDKLELVISDFEKKNNLYKDEEKTSVDASIVLVKDLIDKELKIPNYQRPYRWNASNVLQLLDDIFNSMNSNKKSYRIGSSILYCNGDTNSFDIVDGQQRLTTIAIMLYCMGAETRLLKNLCFNHSDSVANIKSNKLVIDSWLNRHSNHKTKLKDYILNSCEFVEIVVYDLSEAFQMFDSQNGRGKELEAYNLLKAYHIRAMNQETEHTKIECDRRWEAATLYKDNHGNGRLDLLKQVFGEQLFRSRLWSKKEDAFSFSKRDIDEFKGFTLNKNNNVAYPYQNPHLLEYMTSKFYESVLSGMIGTKNRFNEGDPSNMSPFVNINQPIVNGKHFFDYVETYIEIYKRFFVDLHSYQLKVFKDFYKEYCKYKGCDRVGDRYLCELYKSLIIVVFDKFGEDGVMHCYKDLYGIVYKKRLELAQVRYSSIAKYPKEFFTIIQNAKNLSDLALLSGHSQFDPKNKNYDNCEKVSYFFEHRNKHAHDGNR